MKKEITIPYNFKARDYQWDFLEAPQRFKIGVFHRRGGKTKTTVNQQIMRTQLKLSKKLGQWLFPDDPRLTEQERTENNVYYYVLPTYKQAKTVVWDELVKQHVPMEMVAKLNASELAIYYKNGSIQRFVGSEDIDAHRGTNPKDVVFDEFSEQDPQIWTAIFQPVLRENGGTATWIFTPKGKNHSWELLEFAKQNPATWYTLIQTVEDTNGLTEQEIEDARLSTPEALFRQEYYCDFLENAGAFFRRIRQNTYDADDYVDPTHFYQCGFDLAKYNDWTVGTAIDLYNFKVKPQERYNQVDWNFQKLMIEAMARKHNNAKVKIDRTGVGDPIVEDLERRGLNIGEDGAVVFTAQSRRDMLNNLSILLQQDKIKIPNDEGLIAELEAFQYVMTDKGKIEVKTRKGMHDDRVMSLALAVHGVTVPIKNYIDDHRQEEKENKEFDPYAII